MIEHRDIRARAEEWDLREDVVEKDYVLGWVLWGIGSEPALTDTLVFKGGTCLKKCYLETFRFSEDLDFTVMPGGPSTEADVRAILDRLLPRIATESGIQFDVREPRLRTRPNGGLEGRIYYRGPRQSPSPASIRLDLTVDEVVARPPVMRTIRHLYPDALPEPATVRCYSLEELFAEKLRAMGERGRPRDLYDIIYLYNHQDLYQRPDLISQVLEDKCASKGVPVPTIESVTASPNRSELASEWDNMLAHQLPTLAPLEHYWDQVADLFSWLSGAAPVVELAPASASAGEALWQPTPIAWSWGSGPRLEPVRFAGANRLCVDLGYRGSVRRIEPYSLRTTRAGDLLLYGVRTDNRQLRAYRVDRIQSVAVTTEPFTPRFRVEFTASGATYAPPQRTRPRSTTTPSRSSTPYRVECTYCGKVFARKKPSTKINPHKDPDGYPCPGRVGIAL